MKSVLCRVGKHNWAVRTNGDGERYRECRRCGAIKDDELPPSFGSTAIASGGG